MRIVRPFVKSVVPSALALIVLAGFPGCKSVEEPASPASLSVVQGNMQTAAVGTLLPTPVVMRVRGTDGLPLAKVPISFSVTAGGGVVDPPTAVR